jgi:hypothetical protein
MPQITIHDERLGRSREQAMTLDCLTETMTVRELIRQRVYQEVSDYNQRFAEEYPTHLNRFLVTPTEMEARLNRESMEAQTARIDRKSIIDWEKQYELACRGFESNAFFVMIGDTQAEELDESFLVTVDTEVTFVKLVPLVGG